MKTVLRHDAIEIIKIVRQLIDSNTEIQIYLNNLSANIDFSNCNNDEVDILCQGVSNGFIAEILQIISGHSVEVVGNVEKLCQCPCCGYKTLTEKYNTMEETGYDICPYCEWEDDGTLINNSYSSVNHGTILDYQRRMLIEKNKYYIDKWYK